MNGVYDNGNFVEVAATSLARRTAAGSPWRGEICTWANRDRSFQTSEYLTNFTFDPTQAKEFQVRRGTLLAQKPLKVHCRIISATEGEHNNVKASEETERYFIIHELEPA